jgi:hypothetical protein
VINSSKLSAGKPCTPWVRNQCRNILLIIRRLEITLIQDSSKVIQCWQPRSPYVEHIYMETRGQFKSFHDTVYGDSTNVSQFKGTVSHLQ